MVVYILSALVVTIRENLQFEAQPYFQVLQWFETDSNDFSCHENGPKQIEGGWKLVVQPRALRRIHFDK